MGARALPEATVMKVLHMAMASRVPPMMGVHCVIPGDSIEVFPKKVEMDRVQGRLSDLKMVIMGRRMGFFLSSMYRIA